MAAPRPEWQPYKPAGGAARKKAPLDPGALQPKRGLPTRPLSGADKVDRALQQSKQKGKLATGGRPSAGRPGGLSMSTKASTGATDASLMSSMMARLSRAEAALRVANDEIARQDGTIKSLRTKLAKHEAVTNPPAEADLARRCRRLERTVHQMETFLADYGMIWVGDDDSDDGDARDGADGSADPGGLSAAAAAGRGQIAQVTPAHYDTILANVEELNVLAGDGVGQVARRADGSAKIAMPDPVTLRLYANGMMLYDGPFRTLNEPIAQAFLKDLHDGYFPSELQDRYPDGIPFKAHDFRLETYTAAAAGAGRPAFPGVGHQVGGEAKPSILIPTAVQPKPSNVRTVADVRDGAAPAQQSAAALLNRLPASVVRNGKLIDIRGDLAGQLVIGGAAGQKVAVIDTEIVKAMKESAAAIAGDPAAIRPKTPGDMATLQVKSIDGKETIVLKLRFADTIGTARRYIDAQKPQQQPYKLVSAYPRRDLDDSDVLEDVGLTPRATVRMMPTKR